MLLFQDEAIYTRWGRRSCPGDAELIYEGECLIKFDANLISVMQQPNNNTVYNHIYVYNNVHDAL